MKEMDTVSLEEVLKYKNAKVVTRFSNNYNVAKLESEEIFEQTIKWLWLAHHQSKTFPRNQYALSIDGSLKVIDAMWHNFILFTRDYIDFCSRYFGTYIHHVPNVVDVDVNSKVESFDEVVDRKRKQYRYVYDMLGEETFLLWYREYPKIYEDVG